MRQRWAAAAAAAMAVAFWTGPGAAFSFDEVSGAARGDETRAYSYSSETTPLLESFSFRFGNGDHHIQEIWLQTEHIGVSGDEIHLGFHDKNWDDPYNYRVRHVFVPARAGVVDSVEGTCRGRCTAALTPPPTPEHRFVLIGFGMSFLNDDKHIDEIGLRAVGTELTVAFNDKNDDDRFSWFASYMWLSPEYVAQAGTLSGRNVRGEDSAERPGGPLVISGFNVNFRDDDHHLLDFGIWHLPGWDQEIRFSDDNGDDRFDWDLDYTVLTEPEDSAPLVSTAMQVDALVALLAEAGALDRAALDARLRDAAEAARAAAEVPAPARAPVAVPEAAPRGVTFWAPVVALLVLLAGTAAALSRKG